eukprot:scaffold47795_cov68-Phaeocystis_antarctica.AAC.2
MGRGGVRWPLQHTHTSSGRAPAQRCRARASGLSSPPLSSQARTGDCRRPRAAARAAAPAACACTCACACACTCMCVCVCARVSTCAARRRGREGLAAAALHHEV